MMMALDNVISTRGVMSIEKGEECGTLINELSLSRMM